MTDEEIARKAWASREDEHGLPWSKTAPVFTEALTRAAALGREEGRREAAEPKPEPVDEDLLAAREFYAGRLEQRGYPAEIVAKARAGDYDRNAELKAYLSGLKAARAKLAPAGPDAAVLKARELCAGVVKSVGVQSPGYTSGRYDDAPELLDIAAALREGV